MILFGPSTTGPLQRVSSAGGLPQAAGVLDRDYGESSQRFPWFLPDGRHFVFTGVIGTCCPAAKPGRIRIGVLDSSDATTLLQAESSAVYSAGHLLFARDGALMAMAFDADTRRFTGDPFPIADSVASEGSRYASVSASAAGTLLHTRGASRQTTRLTWMDRAGRTLGTVGDPLLYANIALSSSERRVAVTAADMPTLQGRDVWILEAASGTPSRFTFDPGNSFAPVWSPDDQQIAFAANRNGHPSLRIKRVAGVTNEEELLAATDNGAMTPTQWTTDGKYIVFTRAQGTGGSSDIWALPMAGDRKPFAVIATPDAEANAVVSPSGRWIAYQSLTGGLTQVLVQPFPPTGGKFQVSTSGGYHPLWRADGKELYFLSADGRMMAVAVDASDTFTLETPVALFPVNTEAAQGGQGRQFTMTKDGRFLVNVVQQTSTSVPLTVTLNWMAAIQK